MAYTALAVYLDQVTPREADGGQPQRPPWYPLLPATWLPYGTGTWLAGVLGRRAGGAGGGAGPCAEQVGQGAGV